MVHVLLVVVVLVAVLVCWAHVPGGLYYNQYNEMVGRWQVCLVCGIEKVKGFSNNYSPHDWVSSDICPCCSALKHGGFKGWSVVGDQGEWVWAFLQPSGREGRYNRLTDYREDHCQRRWWNILDEGETQVYRWLKDRYYHRQDLARAEGAAVFSQEYLDQATEGWSTPEELEAQDIPF